jgi:hypothetical protein
LRLPHGCFHVAFGDGFRQRTEIHGHVPPCRLRRE